MVMGCVVGKLAWLRLYIEIRYSNAGEYTVEVLFMCQLKRLSSQLSLFLLVLIFAHYFCVILV